MAMDAFATCKRDDLQLAVFSLGPEHIVPHNPRIYTYHRPDSDVPREKYNKQISVIDLFIFPVVLDPNGSALTSGTPSDAIGAGRGALISDWPYLKEYMGDAGIVFGQTEDDLRRCLERIDRKPSARGSQSCVAAPV